MKAPGILFATALLLTIQVISRAQTPSNQAINVGLFHCGWNRSHSGERYNPLADINSDCYEASSNSQCGPCKPQDNHLHVLTSARSDRPRFVYRLMITNTSAKIVRAIEWDYVITDPDTEAEVNRYRFYSEQRVRPKESKTLIEYSTSPPTRVISVKALSRPESDRFIEKVILKRIVYDDGSVWVLQPQPR